jgi:hypothetical protein
MRRFQRARFRQQALGLKSARWKRRVPRCDSKSVFHRSHPVYAHFGVESGNAGKNFFDFLSGRWGLAFTVFINFALLVRLMKLW